jgi:hypothetical protein
MSGEEAAGEITDIEYAEMQEMHRLSVYPPDHDGTLEDCLRRRQARAAEFHASGMAQRLIEILA